ncbi:MAG: hypothetical protein A2V70_19775 [Planctomycetes bacterium RBG_13_63_9]|nr:MAG: hypothetical protein A2V70_19775 [Planctomycetes bacterium RBG_13_63_9]
MRSSRSYLGWTLILALLPLAPRAVHAQEVSGLALAAAMEETLVDVIARNEVSVVAIARIRRQQPGDALNLELRPDPFGRPAATIGPPELTDPDFIPNEYATGVVVDRRGLILTAYHVLGEESDYYVRTHDGKFYQAWIKGADPRSDLAVLATEAVDLEPITFGDAAVLKKGRFVVALGNPYAIARDGQVSASWGIVSNLARKAPPVPDVTDSSGKPTLHHYGTLIQTDAKLNLGTSGGPLLSLDGKMIGLTVSLAAIRGYETAAGYAIPVDETFRRVVRTLKQGREVEYGFLGIQPSNLRPQEIRSGIEGIRVDWVVPGTPAARYGLQPDDIVTAVDGHAIREADSFVLQVGKLPVESVTRLSLVRNGRQRTVDVTLAKYPVRGKQVITSRPDPWRGMRIDYATAVVDAKGPARGGLAFVDDAVTVTEVQEGTPAWQSGLRPGMQVSHVGRTAVRTPKEFHNAVAGKSGPLQLRLVDDDENPVRTVPPGT